MAKAKEVKTEIKTLTSKEWRDTVPAERKETCSKCEWYDERLRRCEICGCFIFLKSWLKGTTCPENKWPVYTIKN